MNHLNHLINDTCFPPLPYPWAGAYRKTKKGGEGANIEKTYFFCVKSLTKCPPSVRLCPRAPLPSSSEPCLGSSLTHELSILLRIRHEPCPNPSPYQRVLSPTFFFLMTLPPSPLSYPIALLPPPLPPPYPWALPPALFGLPPRFWTELILHSLWNCSQMWKTQYYMAFDQCKNQFFFLH